MQDKRYSGTALRALSFVCFAAAAQPALCQAQDESLAAPASTPTPASRTSYGGLGVRLGTTGLGVEYRYGLNRYLDLRAGYQFGSFNHGFDQDSNHYDAKFKNNAAVFLVDLKPFAGGFHFTAGLTTKVPEFGLKAHGEGKYDYNDTTYNGDLKVNGGIDLGKAAPYIGWGWGGTSNGTGFGVSFDSGVLIGQSPKVALAASGTACDASVNASCDPNGAEGFNVGNSADPRALIFQQDLKDEVAKIQHDAKDFRYWPVLQLGLHYRF